MVTTTYQMGATEYACEYRDEMLMTGDIMGQAPDSRIDEAETRSMSEKSVRLHEMIR